MNEWGAVLKFYGAHAGKYEATPKLMELVQHTESDAWLALSLAMHLNLLPLTRQLSCLSGSLWSRTFQVCLQLQPLADALALAYTPCTVHSFVCIKTCISCPNSLHLISGGL